MIARMTGKKTTWLLVAFALAALWVGAPAQAAAPASNSPASDTSAANAAAGVAGQPVATEDLKTLLSTIENPAEREKLAANLRAMIAARQQSEPAGTGDQLFAALSGWVNEASQQITDAAAAIVNVPELFRWIGREVSNPDARANIGRVALNLLIVIGLGLVAHAGMKAVLTRPRRAAETMGASPGAMRWIMRFAHVGLDLAPVIAFAAVAFAVLPFTNPDETTNAVAIAFVNAVVLVRAILVAVGAIVAPDAAALRLLPVGDESANYIVLWVRRLVGTAVYGFFAAEAAFALGLHRRGFAAVLNCLGLAISLMLVILILQNRRFLSEHIRGHTPAPGPNVKAGALDSLRAVLADIWHVLAILYIVALYIVWALRVPGGFEFVLTASLLTVAIVIGARFAAVVVDRGVARGFSIRDDVKQRFPSLEARANRYVPVLNIVAKTVIYGVAGLSLLQVWGVESLSWFASGLGREVLGTAAGIGVVLLVAAVVWESTTIYIEEYLSRTESDFDSYEHYARVRTLLPLFRKVLFMILVAVVGLVVLAQLGINVAPLLAGAGVIGLAVGFGAQKLVQDILNGLFVFLEAAVAVGDVVELGGHAGVVEAMSMRSIRLRDIEGNVHTIPYSAVSAVLNRTKGFSYYVFDLSIPYVEDVDRIIEVLKEVGTQLRGDKSLGPLILDALEVLGLDRFAETTVIVKGRIKTLPGKQWLVGREFNRRIKRRFQELKIVVPAAPQPIVVTLTQPGTPDMKVQQTEGGKA